MFFWNMGKPWRKAEPFPKKNRKPCWQQYLKICRKTTGHRCSRSWGLWDCKIEKIRRIFQKEKYAVSVYRESRSNSSNTAAGEQPQEACFL